VGRVSYDPDESLIESPRSGIRDRALIDVILGRRLNDAVTKY
jgi:hypothetical protein